MPDAELVIILSAAELQRPACDTKFGSSNLSKAVHVLENYEVGAG
jgi:hypothetical protein